MSASDRDPESGDIQEDAIDALKRRVEEVAGEGTTVWESDTLSPEQRRHFWQRVVDHETAPSTTDFQRLTNTGIDLPEPDSMDDDRMAAKLWEVIDALADLGVFLRQTDHLSDRDLYTALWRDVLRQEVPIVPEGEVGAWIVDLLGGGSEQDIHLYLKYYADEEDRRRWKVDYPDDEMPEREQPPFDRDRRLPEM